MYVDPSRMSHDAMMLYLKVLNMRGRDLGGGFKLTGLKKLLPRKYVMF